MPLIKVDETGSLGISTDLEPHTLPPNAWTGADNVRFIDRYAEKFQGSEEVFATPLNAPYFLYSMTLDGDAYWVYPGLAAVGSYGAAAHGDITRTVGGAYNATNADLWTGAELGGILLLNNPTDVPQYWANVSTSTPLADLTNWPAGYLCKAMTSYKSHLFAMNMTQGGTDYPHRVLWSHLADPGSVPSTWDITDPTKDAGEVELSDTNSGGIVNAKELGNTLLIYKENSIFECNPSNDIYVFGFNRLYISTGLASIHGVAAIPRQKQHIVYTGDDIIIHNGAEAETILSEKERRQLFNSIDGTNFFRSFMAVNRVKQEIWFCYPLKGATYPNRALVYNYETKVISHRNLPATNFIATGNLAEGTATPWDSASGLWDAQSGRWGDGSVSLIESGLLLADQTNTKLFKLDSSNQENGSNMSVYLERQGMAYSGYDQRGNPIIDLVNRKVLGRLWLKMEGGPVKVRLLVQEEIDGPVTYSPSMVFDPSTQRYLDLENPLSGLLYGIRIESTSDVDWRLHGYNLQIEVLGDQQ